MGIWLAGPSSVHLNMEDVMRHSKHPLVSVCKTPGIHTGNLAVVTDHEPHPIDDLVFTFEILGIFMRVTWLSHVEADEVLEYLQLPDPWLCLGGPFDGMACWPRVKIVDASQNAQLRFEAAQ